VTNRSRLTDYLSLADIARALREGKVTPSELVASLCRRIELHDEEILSLLPEPGRRARLEHEAAELERRYPDVESRPALFGVPVGVKDIFRVDGFDTRAGSALPAELFSGPEAACVTRLRRAGALIVGKTATAEFAYREPPATRNPRALGHTPGGSSSGSAAAVAAGFAALALGSQTIGSVIRPAAFCGIVGFKPSLGRISTQGMLPFSHSVDHVGLFSQDVAGMRLAATELLDAAQSAQSVRTLRVVGVPEGAYLDQVEPASRAAFEKQLGALQARGLEIRRVPCFGDVAALAARHDALILRELAQVHDEWFARYGALYRPFTAARIRMGRGISEADYSLGLKSASELRAALHDAMDAHGIEVWASPAALGPAPESQASTGEPAMNLPWTHAGLPTLTLPSGSSTAGLPLGLQLSARFDADEELLAWAEQMEALL